MFFRTRSVVIANGGEQVLHPEFFKWFPSKEASKENVITSDYFLKKEGYTKTMLEMGRLNKTSKKIVIVGGSHSGFSCAWLMLKQRQAMEL